MALIYPPSCDPTAPYLAVPMLTGFLRSRGATVLPIDANIDAYDALLSPGSLRRLRDRIEARIADLDAQKSLSHVDQLIYSTLQQARGDAHAVPTRIVAAKATLRHPTRFYDPDAYGRAVATIDAALRVVSAAYAPLNLDFTAYRTPFSLTSPDEIAHDAQPDHDPFDPYTERDLIPRLRAAAPRIVGLSVCFPGQLQPTFSMAPALNSGTKIWSYLPNG